VQVENVLIATRFMNQFANVNINPKDVVAGNQKVILSIMWRLIVHFGVPDQQRKDDAGSGMYTQQCIFCQASLSLSLAG
jgi:delta-aminolevulinic acid dehydratase/porphobilinogen synthase